ncbi:MAG: NUDIX domain-containing protein [Candidatus Moraniibacteriota bacterium]
MPKPIDLEKQKYMFTDDIKFLQKALVFHPDRQGIFLALKRSPDSSSRPNDWDLAGGNVLFGELHEDSLRREIFEEANLEVGDFVPVQIVTTYDKEKEIYYLFNGFFCKAKSDDVKISSEHCEYRWVTKEQFIDLKTAQFLVDLIVVAFENYK